MMQVRAVVRTGGATQAAIRGAKHIEINRK